MSASKTDLRDLPATKRHFWREEQAEESGITVCDRRQDGTQRVLAANELAAMALNEIAAQRGSGYFFHLLGRDGWKKGASEGSSRAVPQPGPDFPALAYINYTWSPQSVQRFYTTSQRARYLICDGLLNPPTPSTPVFCFQYAAHNNYPLFATSHPSFIVLQTKTAFYLVPCDHLTKLLGVQRDKKGEKRLKTISWLWKADPRCELLKSFELGSLEAVYQDVMRRCQGQRDAVITAAQLRSFTPRPRSPVRALAFGAVDVTGEAGDPPAPEGRHCRAGPSTRRGGRLNRTGTGRTRARADAADSDTSMAERVGGLDEVEHVSRASSAGYDK